MRAAQFPVVLLMGPTAAGKTRLAFELARQFPVEVVSVDSALVYRGLDIGTAKPTPGERTAVPHHLIDIRDAAESYSAGQFVRDALEAIAAIRGEGRVPLLVGGTMLYFHALLHGLASLPEADPSIRAEIERDAARSGWPALHAELARVDPVAGARIHPNDPQRLQRALEVYRATGIAISALQARRHPALADIPHLPLVLDVPDRADLHARVERRFDSMMAAGFLDEVRALHQRADLHARKPAMRAVGYRQLWAHLDGECTLEEGKRRAVAATRQLAKRQFTWLRALERAHWLDASANNTTQRACDLVRTIAANFS